MNLHVHSAPRQRKSLGCEHKKRVEKRWRITHADIRPGVYGPLDDVFSGMDVYADIHAEIIPCHEG